MRQYSHTSHDPTLDNAYSDGYTSAEYYFWAMMLLFCVFICVQLAAVSYYLDANPPPLPRYYQPARRQNYPAPTAPEMEPMCVYNIPSNGYPQ